MQTANQNIEQHAAKEKIRRAVETRTKPTGYIPSSRKETIEKIACTQKKVEQKKTVGERSKQKQRGREDQPRNRERVREILLDLR